tara:strand:- start:743 stop:2374 length:1632 start_codon:yes stop_codon:yes gene_type:complete
MSNTIKHKRGTSNPSASDLSVGELAIRSDNGHLFTKTNSGSVIEHKDITNNNQLTNGAGYLTSSSNLNASKLSSGTVNAARLPNHSAALLTSGTIPAARIGSDAIDQNKIADDAVGAAQLVDGSVGTTQLANNGVTFAKLEDVAQNRILGRTASGTGDCQELTAANVRSLINVADGANNITNNNQLTNGAGYITSQRSVESVQDIVGDMVTGNSESGITVTYQDSDGTLDFSVASQTDQNFTTALKNKLDGIASSATNVTNNNQLTNGAGYITASNSAITNKMPKSGGTFSGTVNLGGNDIDNVGRMTGNGLTLEDDGESSPTFQLLTDDEAPYAMQISNSTYSNQQVGLLTFVKNNGDAELLHAGNGEFKDFSIGTSLGIGFVTCIKIDGSEQQVELYNGGVRKFETTSTGVEVTGNCKAGSFRSDDLLPPVFEFTNGNKAGQLSVGNANIDGTGTVTLESDFNVSSISDSGSGVYDVSFDENYKNSHYIVTAESGLISSTSSASTTVDIRNMSSSGFRLLIEDVDAGFIDVDYIMFSIFEN